MTFIMNQSISYVRLARIAGALYFLVIICGLFSEVYVRSNLIVHGDASLTTQNIMANEFIYRMGFISDLIMLLCDLVIATILYVVLKSVSQTLALGATLFRVVMVSALAINLLNYFNVILLLSGDSYFTVFNQKQIDAFVYLSLETYTTGYAIGLSFFAFHCLLLGYLIYLSNSIPKYIGVMMYFASLSYIADSLATFLIASYKTEDYAFIMVPALLAELTLSSWLLFKGVKPPHLPKQNLMTTSY